MSTGSVAPVTRDALLAGLAPMLLLAAELDERASAGAAYPDDEAEG